MRCIRLVPPTAVLCASFFVFGAPTDPNAADGDKAVYVGGTLSNFPLGDRTIARFNAEGRIDTQADSLFAFDAGAKGKITIPYSAIVSVTFGRTEPFGVYDEVERRGARVLPRNFYSKNDFLLTIVYQDPPDTEQVVVLWLGKEIVRPTLAALEERSGKAIGFADAQGCAQYMTRDECGYAGPGAMKGIKRVFVDTGGDKQGRDLIVSEIQRARLGMEMSERRDDADLILNFRASRGFSGSDVGIGEIFVRQDRVRLVTEFAESGRSAEAVTTKFARTFVEAYMKDNQIR